MSSLSLFLNRFFCLALLSFSPLLVGCRDSNQSSISVGCTTVSSPCLKGKAKVQMITDRGIIILELNGDVAPVTSGNFADLVRKGVYNGTIFHRVIKDPAPFVAQAGDPSTSDPKTLKKHYGTGVFIDPMSGQPRVIPLEMKLKNQSEPLYGSLVKNPIDLIQLELSHQRGALAMARSQALDSASAQFYIALRHLPELDGRYAVFGKVIEGMEVVDEIQQGDKILKATFLLSVDTP